MVPVNIGEQTDMKGKLQKELPQLHWTCCCAHCVEFACKDEIFRQPFKDIAQMLLHLYYLHFKPPNKFHELADIVKEVWEFSGCENLPVRLQGSCWIGHKCKALQRLVDRYGAYLNHVTTLTEDRMLKSTDRARLKGYLTKWKRLKTIIGAAMYMDVLKACKLNSWTLSLAFSTF